MNPDQTEKASEFMRNRMGKGRGKGKRKICEEKVTENFCYVCKDGGRLVICDQKNCEKVYHPECVGKDDYFFESTRKLWICGWHYCFNCNKSPNFHCLGCQYAVCKKCFDDSEFAIIKEGKVLCHNCWDLVVIVEGNLKQDFEGNEINLNDRGTCEGLFKEYWEMIKGKESLSSAELSPLLTKYEKGKNSLYQRKTSENEEKDDLMSCDDDIDNINKHKPETKRKRKRKFIPGEMSCSIAEKIIISKTHIYPPVVEEEKNDDGSRFLGKHFSSQIGLISGDSDIDNIHNHKPETKKERKSIPDELSIPIAETNVMSKDQIHPLVDTQKIVEEKDDDGSKDKSSDKHGQTELISCDSDLEDTHKHKLEIKRDDETSIPIARKNIMSKNQIYPNPCMDAQFTKNLEKTKEEEKNDDGSKNRSSNKHFNSSQTACKESRLWSSIGEHVSNKGDIITKVSCFASINAENLKLIYLKKSLVEELAQQPEGFEDKVIGSIVMVKTSPDEYHLHRVIGVSKNSTNLFGELLVEFYLKLSFMPTAIPVSKLEDSDFKEKECEDLRQKVKDNLLQKLTVVELQEKAKNLHKDITKHWIARELARLQKKIDEANLQELQRQKDEYISEKERLEQQKEELLQRMPSVSAEIIIEVGLDPKDYLETDKQGVQGIGSPQSVLQLGSTAPDLSTKE